MSVRRIDWDAGGTSNFGSPSIRPPPSLAGTTDTKTRPLALALELDAAGGQREQGVVLATGRHWRRGATWCRAGATMMLPASDVLAAENLHAEALAVGVAPVAG